MQPAWREAEMQPAWSEAEMQPAWVEAAHAIIYRSKPPPIIPAKSHLQNTLDDHVGEHGQSQTACNRVDTQTKTHS